MRKLKPRSISGDVEFNPTPRPTPTPSPAPGMITGNVRLDSLHIPAGTRIAFDPNTTTTLEVSGNVVVEGVLEMRPASPSVVHTLRFVGINEASFVGGHTHTPLASDVGLWVMGAGQLDLHGSSKEAWNRTGTSTTWAGSDELVVSPTAYGDAGSTGFASFTAGSGVPSVNFTLPSGSTRTFTAEVLNLTRNVRIEGTRTGRAHVMIQSAAAHVINYVSFRNVGPRRSDGFVLGRYPLHFHMASRADTPLTGTLTFTQNSLTVTGSGTRFTSQLRTTDSIFRDVDGSVRLYGIASINSDTNLTLVERYTGRSGSGSATRSGLGEGSRGSQVIGSVVRDSGNHAFVPHCADGITFRDCVAYNVMENAFWWDEKQTSDDITYDNCVAAFVRHDASDSGTRLNGFFMGRGDRNVCTNCVAVGIQGASDAAGYNWPEASAGVWTFANNMAHNNRRDGLFAWQNDGFLHVVDNFVAYHCGGTGIDHGAYISNYRYNNPLCLGNGESSVVNHATGAANTGKTPSRTVPDDGHSLTYEGAIFDGQGRASQAIIVRSHPLAWTRPAVFSNCTLAGFTGSRAVRVDDRRNGKPEPPPGLYHFVGCQVRPNGASVARDLEPTDFELVSMGNNTTIRVQRRDLTAFEIVNLWSGTTWRPVIRNIARFV